jgi:hypothetical protein
VHVSGAAGCWCACTHATAFCDLCKGQPSVSSMQETPDTSQHTGQHASASLSNHLCLVLLLLSLLCSGRLQCVVVQQQPPQPLDRGQTHYGGGTGLRVSSRRSAGSLLLLLHVLQQAAQRGEWRKQCMCSIVGSLHAPQHAVSAAVIPQSEAGLRHCCHSCLVRVFKQAEALAAAGYILTACVTLRLQYSLLAGSCGGYRSCAACVTSACAVVST